MAASFNIDDDNDDDDDDDDHHHQKRPSNRKQTSIDGFKNVSSIRGFSINHAILFVGLQLSIIYSALFSSSSRLSRDFEHCGKPASYY